MLKSKIILSIIFLLNGVLLSQNNHYIYSPGSYIPGDLIVQLSEKGSIQNIISGTNSSFHLDIIKELSPTAHIWQLKFDYTQISHEDILEWLYKQPQVELAQKNYYLNLRSTIPNDVNFSEQWHHNNTGQTGGIEDADIDSDLAWEITTGGTTASGHDIVIALI